MAQFKGDLRFIELLVRHPELEVDGKTGKHQQTALMIASYYGNTSVVQLLLAAGANMHLIDNGKWTVMHQAAKSGNTFLLDIFHRGGVNLHAKDKDNRTALHWAAYHNRIDSILCVSGVHRGGVGGLCLQARIASLSFFFFSFFFSCLLSPRDNERPQICHAAMNALFARRGRVGPRVLLFFFFVFFCLFVFSSSARARWRQVHTF